MLFCMNTTAPIAHLERNKTDKKDAERICGYGIERKPEASVMTDRLYFECKTLNKASDKLQQK